jgi:hypothetical protein
MNNSDSLNFKICISRVVLDISFIPGLNWTCFAELGKKSTPLLADMSLTLIPTNEIWFRSPVRFRVIVSVPISSHVIICFRKNSILDHFISNLKSRPR